MKRDSLGWDSSDKERESEMKEAKDEGQGKGLAFWQEKLSEDLAASGGVLFFFILYLLLPSQCMIWYAKFLFLRVLFLFIYFCILGYLVVFGYNSYSLVVFAFLKTKSVW